MYEKGITGMRYSISNTAEYGDLTRGKRVIGEPTRAAMKEILAEIQSGDFAREWIAENNAGQENFKRMREEESHHQVEEEGTRAAGDDGLDRHGVLRWPTTRAPRAAATCRPSRRVAPRTWVRRRHRARRRRGPRLQQAQPWQEGQQAGRPQPGQAAWQPPPPRAGRLPSRAGSRRHRAGSLRHRGGNPRRQASQPPAGWQQPQPQWGWQPQPTVPDNGPAVAGFVLSLTAIGLLVLSAGLSSIVSVGCAGFGIFYSLAGRRRVDRGETPKHRGLGAGRVHHRDRGARARAARHRAGS